VSARIADGTFTWDELPLVMSDRGEVTATAVGERIYLIGGLTPDRTLPDVDVFDPAGGEWSRAPDLSVGGVNHAMSVELDGTLYVFGGYLGPGWHTLPPWHSPFGTADGSPCRRCRNRERPAGRPPWPGACTWRAGFEATGSLR
jgi:Kelch motif